MRKTCKTCGRSKPDKDYYPGNRACKPCSIKTRQEQLRADPAKREAYLKYQKNYQATWGRKHRAERFVWLDEVKNSPCLDCGQKFPPECMDFDHRVPATKLFDVSLGVVSGRSVESVKEEIAKCDLICANCHRIRTARQQNRGRALNLNTSAPNPKS